MQKDKSKRVILLRHWSDGNQTTGSLLVVNEEGQPIFGSLCIERGDRNNKKNVSRIPSGTYPLVLEYSPKFEMNLWEIKNVPNRSECKIHSANFWDQLNGCIAPGINLTDIDKDGYYDVTYSSNTTKMFHKALKNLKETTITIIDEIVY
ncbi:DUF5675 family protein [Aquimarina algiphila]|uniref:DUF5675 domain-containing protein n=1 Tax=Aquimarina algiphila TaxID=2047982 RepID=A0A554VE31_9FLAO|nr:DUF5675 family protein [Aquimarina algiphila]TSE05262.1 hypothetical protein FOF46_23655 [Aquimarina algiphila]